MVDGWRLMEDMFKNFFGEDGTASIDYPTFSEALSKSGLKLVDVNSGEYVSKAKYERVLNEYNQYKTNNDISKYADYDTIREELEALKAEKADNELAKAVASKNVDERFVRFVISEVKSLVTEDFDFETALNEYLKQNPQFLINPKKERTQGVIKIGSSGELEQGSGHKNRTTNDRMNKILRGVK